MNRKYLFRGKNKITNEWVYGSLVIDEDKEYFILPENSQPGEPFIHVIPETVGQYSQMNDKNDSKIFDGDIIELIDASGNTIKVVVEFAVHRRLMGSGFIVDIPSFAFVMDGVDPTFPIVRNYKGVHDLELFEVVGNVHDNPELLK